MDKEEGGKERGRKEEGILRAIALSGIYPREIKIFVYVKTYI